MSRNVLGPKKGKIPVAIGVGINVAVDDEVLEGLKRARWPAGSLVSYSRTSFGHFCSC